MVWTDVVDREAGDVRPVVEDGRRLGDNGDSVSGGDVLELLFDCSYGGNRSPGIGASQLGRNLSPLRDSSRVLKHMLVGEVRDADRLPAGEAVVGA